MRKYLLTLIIVSFLTNAKAQFFLGLRSSPYGGVTNVNYNPAIADSRFIADVNLLAVGSTVSNNYVGVDRKAIWKRNYVNSNLDFQENYMKERVNGKNKSAYVGTIIQGPLSFMCSWGKGENKNKNAFAFSWHHNTVFNADKIDETFARIAYYGVGYTADSLTNFVGRNLTNANINLRTMTWLDYGLTYSRVVHDEGDHFVIVGGTLKLLQGMAGGYAYVKDLNYKWEDFDTLSIFQTEANYAYSEGYVTSRGVEDDANQITKNLFSFKYAAPSVAVDLGVIYQWRPDKEKYIYQMDCEDHWRYDQNRYKLAAGFSVIDIGGIRFKRGEYSGNFTADIQNWYVKDYKFPDGLQSIDDTIRKYFTVDPNVGDKFTMWLPTRFNLFVDYNIAKGFGVNLAGSISPNMAPKRNMVHHMSLMTLTPKYDHAWFGAYLPFSIGTHANPSLGLTLRMGPLTVGMGDILGLFAKKYVFNTDIHASLKVTIPYRKIKDKDKDGVSNKKDLCKTEKGNCASKGCPDRDGDGLKDSEDKCPDNPGPIELKGCPDTDADGVIDMEDDCPVDKGLVELKGCPDRDGDKVIDKVDECPDVAGPADHMGCPDTDGDGLYDNEDKCVTMAGPKENNGCPWPDRDKDGVADKDDACPDVPGVPEEKGCPKLEVKEIETIKVAFENLEFETGKDIIRKSSYASLNALANLLIAKEHYGLRLDGHTDNVGSDDKNMILSQKRAVAVQNYLIKKGVDAAKLEAFGHGETMPIADNKTAAGRQKNRRVEMKIVFK